MAFRITPEQFQAHQQLWNQPVEDGDVEGQKQKTNAAFWVAYCFEKEEGGVERNREQTVRILEQAIQEQDHIDGNNHHDNTGKHRCLLAYLIEEIENNRQRANQLHRQAVPRLEMEVQEGGNDDNFQVAAYDLGCCLFFERGVEKDPSCAIHWWKAAAELGHVLARFHLFHHCMSEPHVAEVLDWWRQIATEHEDPWAQTALGSCYGYGRGVEKDLVTAVEWYNKAIAQGDNFATGNKQRLLRQLFPWERYKTLGCVARNQKLERVEQLIEQAEPDNVPLGLWAHALASFQHQENPPWEAPSPTFRALCDGVVPQLQE